MNALDFVIGRAKTSAHEQAEEELADEAAADLAKLRTARDEARKIIGQLTWDITAITWMKKFGG